MRKTVIYLNKDKAEDKYGGYREGYYIKETGEFIAKNTLKNPSDERIKQQENFYTEMINDVQQDLQSEAKEAFLNLSELGITAYAAKNSADDLTKGAKGLMSAGEDLKDELDLRELLSGNMTKSFKEKAENFGQAVAKVAKDPVEKGIDYVFNDWALEADERKLNQEQKKNKQQTDNILSAADKIKKMTKANAADVKDKVKIYGKTGQAFYKTRKWMSFYDDMRKGNTSYMDSVYLNDCNFAAEAAEEVFNQVKDFITVWAPAINRIRNQEKYDDFQFKSTAEQKNLRKEFKTEVQLEVKYEKKAAQITEIIMILGFILIKIPSGITTIIGLLSILGSQGIADEAVEILKEKNKRRGNKSPVLNLSPTEYVEAIWNNLKGKDNPGGVLGANNLFVKLECGRKKVAVVQEMGVKGPGLFDGIKAFIKDGLFEQIYIQIENLLAKDTELFDLQTYKQLLSKDTVVETEFNAIRNYYGSLTTISEYLIKKKSKYIKQNDIPFVAFLDAKKISAEEVMTKLVEQTFNLERQHKNRQYKKYSYKQILHKFDTSVPRLIHAGKIDTDNCINQLIITKGRKSNLPPLKGGFPRPEPYLEELKELLPEKYLKKLLSQTIQVGPENHSNATYGLDQYNIDYYYIFSIDVLNTWLDSKLDLEDENKRKDDDLDYEKLLSTERNNIFIKNKLVGKLFDDSDRKYDYIIISQYYYELQTKEHRLFFKDNYDILPGSEKLESNNGDKEVFEFWPDIGSASGRKLKHNIKKSRIKITGEVIGKNLERVMEAEDKFDQIFSKQEYEEKFPKAENRILIVRYTYDLNGSLLTLYSPKLIIRYNYVKSEKWENAVDEWNTIVIQDFADLDYGIDIPDVGATLEGTQGGSTVTEFKEMLKKAEDNLEVKLDEVVEQGRGMLKAVKQYLKAEELTEIIRDEKYKKYIFTKGDTLWQIAKEFLGAGNRWPELEKESGGSFTEEEAKEIQVGSKVYIAKEKIDKYKKKCKHCKQDSFELLIDDIYTKLKENLESKWVQKIIDKLNILADKTWYDNVQVTDFLEFMRGYNILSQLLNDNSYWNYRDTFKAKYEDWSCDLYNDILYSLWLFRWEIRIK